MRERFHAMHAATGGFVLPNPWDVGSARVLEQLGFVALATTSSGFAASLGRGDGQVTQAELVEHVAAIAAAVAVPLNVDAERCCAGSGAGPEELAAIAGTVDLLADAGAAGFSIEDYDPAAAAIDPLEVAVARVGAAVSAGARHGLVVTARAENHLHGVDDLDDTIRRLQAYRDAGANCVYAPGLTVLDDIRRLVAEVAVPVNVLAMPAGPSVPELLGVGVRRVSTGGALAWAAYGALARAAQELQTRGTSTYTSGALPAGLRSAAFHG